MKDCTKVYAVAILILLLLSCGSGSRANDNIALGKKMIILDHALAMDYFDEVLKSDPKSSEAHYLRGICYFLEGDNESGGKELEAIVKNEPNSAHAWTCLGNFNLCIGLDYQEAIKCFDKAIKLDANFTPAYIHKAVAIFRDTTAFMDYDEAADAGISGKLPKEKEAAIRKALDCLEKAGNAKEYQAVISYNKGTLLDSIFEDKKAVDCFSDAIKQKPVFGPTSLENLSYKKEFSNPMILGNDMVCYLSSICGFTMTNFMSRNISKDRKVVMIGDNTIYALGSNDGLAFSYYKRGVALIKNKLRDYENGVKDLDTAIKLNGSVYQFYMFRAMAQYGLDDTQKSMADRDKCQKVADELAAELNDMPQGELNPLIGLSKAAVRKLIGPENESKGDNLIYRLPKANGKGEWVYEITLKNDHVTGVNDISE